MNKLELIKIHLILFQTKQFLEQNQVAGDFTRYSALNVSPLHVHKSRKEHKKAILVLGKAISQAISQREQKTETPAAPEKAAA